MGVIGRGSGSAGHRWLRVPGGIRHAGARVLALGARCRRSWETKTGWYRWVAAGTAVTLCVGLGVVAVVLATGGSSGPPAQQAGTAAGRPHRVPASSTIATVQNGRVVPGARGAARSRSGVAAEAAAAEAAAALPASRRPKKALPVSRPARRLSFPKRGQAAPERARTLKAPAAPATSGYNAKTSKVLAGQTAPDQIVYQNTDGTRTAMEYQSPEFFQRSDGTWASINTSLVPAGDTAGTNAPDAAAARPMAAASPSPMASASPSPSLAPTPTPAPPTPAAPSPTPSASAPASPPASTPASAPNGWRVKAAASQESFAPYADAGTLVSLPVGPAQTVGFGVQGAAHVAGSASGDTVTYANALAASDLRYVAGSGLVTEQVILQARSAPSSYAFPLTLTGGITARQSPGGPIVFVNAKGQTVAQVEPGYMTDSDIDPHSGDGAYSPGVTYTLATVAGRQVIRMTLDTAWLDASARVFPVTVDPSVSDVNSNGTTYVESPGSSDYSSNTEIDVGTYNGGSNVAKSFLKFDNVSSSLKNDYVLGARLGVFNSWSYSCSPRSVSVYPVTSSWSVSGSKSYPGPSTGKALASKSFATGWVQLGDPQSDSPCPNQWEGFNLGTAGNTLLNGWTHGTTANNGLALGASSSDSYGWKKFTSDNSSGGDPFLAVTYSTDGASYSLVSKTPVTQVTPNANGRIAIKVTNLGSTTWTPTNGYELSYEVYNAKGQRVPVSPQVFTPMPSTVAPNQSVIVNAQVNELPVGSYAINFDMYKNATSSSPVSFYSEGVQPLAVGLYVPQPPPVVSGVYPPNGYSSPADTPELSTTAFSTTNTTITYNFTVTCDPLPGTVCPASTVSSGSIYTPYWTVSTPLDWDEPYTWTVTATTNGASTTVGPVSITPEVPQPDISSQLGQSGGPSASGGSSGEPFDPESGNYSTSATDAAVAVPGPSLQISRTYNSLNPASTGAFGAGWSSNLGVAVTPDSDGSGSVVVTMPDGSQARFGYKNTSGSGVVQYAPPMGSPDVLTHNTNGTWTLGVSGGTQYDFTSAGVLTQITDPAGLTQTYTNNAAGEPVTITDTASGRTLTLAWATPAGGLYAHVTSVTTNAVGSGQSGVTWTYAYSGDKLTSVCAPGGGCTGYTYGTTGSHYATGVMDSGPRSYYRLGDASGATSATDAVDENLGSTAGTYANVTLGAAGPLAGSGATAASFNGSSSQVSLANNLVSDSTDVTIELWFKDTGDGGVLFSYDADPITDAATTGDNAAHVPALYVGGNGKLYGELYNGSTDPMSSSIAVNDGDWHYAVLTGSATSQSLYLDGNLVGTLAGQINQESMIYNTVGAGFWAGWPEAISETSPVLSTDPYGHFTGSIGEVAVYPHALGQPAVTSHFALAGQTAPELTQVTLPSGRTAAQVSYDTVNDRVSSYTGENGGTWQIGSPSASGYIASSEGLASATSYVTVTTPAGSQEVYGYDAVNGGRLVSYTPSSSDPPRTFGYDAGGFLNAMTDADGNSVSFTNDADGNVLSRTWHEVEPAAITAGPATSGARAAAASSSCCTTYYTYYDNAANPLDPRNNQLTGTADARSASATDTTYLTTYAYNAAGELTSSTTPPTTGFASGRTTSYTYSTSSTPGYGGSGTVPPGLLISQSTPGGAVTGYQYYSDGDLAQVTQPGGARTVYTYDGLGRALTAVAYSDTYPAGLTTTYSYTALNQPAKVTYPGVPNKATAVTHTLQDAYTYDADGNLLTQAQSDLTGSDPARTTTYTYNDQGELASVTQPAGATSGGSSQSDGASSANPAGTTTGYTYDASGNVATMVDGDGNEYDYTYNEYNEPTQVTLTSNSTNQSSSAATCAPGQTPNPDGSCALVVGSYAYDPAGLLAATTDAMGRITNDFYDGNQDLIAVQQQPPASASGTVPPGRQTAYTYDAAGDLASEAVSNLPVTAADTTTTNWAYNAADQVTSTTADAPPSGTSSGAYADRTTSYLYNADNLVTQQTVSGPSGSTTTAYGYNSADDQTSQTVQDGSTSDETTWGYDQLGQQTSMVTPDGNASGATAASYTTNYAYDQAGDLSQVTGAPVATAAYTAQTPATTRPVATYGYDTFGDQTQAKDADGNTTTTAYDGDGRVTAVTQPSYTPPGSSTPITAKTTYGYDGNGNLTSVTDPRGNTTSYAYDALGDVVTQTDPQLTGQSAPGVWTYAYDSDGEELSATSPTGAGQQATYDYFGDQATTTQDIRSSSGTAYNTTSNTYDYLGDPLTTTTPDGAVTTDTYDHLGELTAAGDDLGDTTSYAYNYLGDVSKVTNPDKSFTADSYDPAGNLTSAQEYGIPPAPPAVGSPVSTQSYGYDQDGNQTSAEDGNQHTTTYGYNAADEMTSAVQPVSATASDTSKYTYDAAGNQTSVTGGRGNATWTTYNSWDLPESVIEPATATATTAAQRTWTTAYNADGATATVTQPGGISLSYSYDQLGDLTAQSGSGASAPTTAQTFGYDTAGDLTSATAPGGTDSFTYNDAGQVTAASGPSGSASFTYNNDGLMTSRSDKAGATSYTYDKADRLSTVADPLTGATLTYGYNPDSLASTISYAKGGVTGPEQVLAYTGLQQLASDTLKSASGSTVASESYTYDADGNLSTEATTGYAGSASTTYGYDQADELTSATTGAATTSYGYDADGDLTSAAGTSYTYNAQDQPVSSATSSGTTTYGYTLSGALASVTPPSGSAQSYTSNAYGQTVTAPGGISYAYDGLGRLASRTAGSATATLAYSGADDTVASDGTTSYAYDPAGDPVAEQASGGTAAATLTDVHGDVAGTFSPASGTSSLAASAAYSPYGSVTAKSGSMPSLGYQDQYTDPSTGDTDMSARWYAPSTGTFTSGDSTPAGMPDPSELSPTPYGYVSGNPLTNTDTSGHFCITCVIKKVVRVSCDLDPYCLLGQALNGNDGLLSGETVSGCEDEICGGHSGAGHQCLEFGKCYTGGGGGGSGGDRDTGGGGCGFYCYVGIGIGVGVAVCTYEPELCASEVEAEAPPPPPPPQDCYAGADPECSPPSPPDWLKDDKYEPDKPSETTNPKDIAPKDQITGQAQSSDEYLEQHEEEVKGLEQQLSSENSGAQASDGSGDDSLTRDAGNRVGKPGTPEAGSPDAGSPEAGGDGAGEGGGGNPPATTPDAPEPGEPTGNARFTVGSDGTVTDNAVPRFSVGADGTVADNSVIEPSAVYGPGQSYDAQQAYENLGIAKPDVAGQTGSEASTNTVADQISGRSQDYSEYTSETRTSEPDRPDFTATGAPNPAGAPNGLKIMGRILFIGGVAASLLSQYQPIVKFLLWLYHKLPPP